MPTSIPPKAARGLDQDCRVLPEQESYPAFPHQAHQLSNFIHPPANPYPSTLQCIAASQSYASQPSSTRRMSTDQAYLQAIQLSHNQEFNLSALGPAHTGYPNNNYSLNPGQAPLLPEIKLVFENNFQEIPNNWTEMEQRDYRRLVKIFRREEGNAVLCWYSLEQPKIPEPSSTVVSCIYCTHRKEFFITSVDCIQLLDFLLQKAFSIDEKNRIRRNLEGFKPMTVSKMKPETLDLFKLIMAFANPKPRNIEKDIKVFRWRDLEQVLAKIVAKTNKQEQVNGVTRSAVAPYPLNNHRHQAEYQRRHSQPTNLAQRHQPYPTPYQSSMPTIAEQTPLDQFSRRHSMSDQYSAVRQHNHLRSSSLSHIVENYNYCPQLSGLSIAEGSTTPSSNLHYSYQPGYQTNQQFGHHDTSYYDLSQE